MLNAVPNRNDAMGVVNNVHLTTMGGAKQFLMAAVYIVIIKKSRLTYQRREITICEQERFVRMEINIALEKNEGYIHSSLGSRSISVGRQGVSDFLRFTTSIQ